MSSQLATSDRRILIAAGVLLLGLFAAAALLVEPQQTEIYSASSYSAAPGGGKAAWLLLQQLGHDARRWELPPQRLPQQGAGVVLVLADPQMGISDREAEAIRHFVERGGQVLATGQHGLRLVASKADWNLRKQGSGWEHYKALIPSPLTHGAPEISMKEMLLLNQSEDLPLAIYGDAQHKMVAVRQLGEGHLIWWASAVPLTTAGLQEPGNMELLINCTGPHGALVLWDEYYHGRRGSFWSYFAATPLPWGLAQAGVLLAIAVAVRGRRWGPLRAWVEPPRTSPLEFVETVADLYERAGASAGAVEISCAQFRGELARKLGLPASAPAADFAGAAAAQLGWDAASLCSLLQSCEASESAARVGGAKALELVRALHAHTTALRRGGKPASETS